MPAAVAAGVTPGPGRGPSDFERMQRRHRGVAASSALLHSLAATSAWRQPAIHLPGQAVRAFNKRVEVRSAWEALPALACLAVLKFRYISACTYGIVQWLQLLTSVQRAPISPSEHWKHGL